MTTGDSRSKARGSEGLRGTAMDSKWELKWPMIAGGSRGKGTGGNSEGEQTHAREQRGQRTDSGDSEGENLESPQR